jgi:hypothetical protein
MYLTLESDGGIPEIIESKWEYYILASVLLELLAEGKIDVQDSQIKVLTSEKTEDELSNFVLDELRKQSSHTRIASQIHELFDQFSGNENFRKKFIAYLQKNNFIEVETKSFMGVNYKYVYKIIDIETVKKLKKELINSLNANDDHQNLILIYMLREMDILHNAVGEKNADKLSDGLKTRMQKLSFYNKFNKLVHEVNFASIFL